MSSWTLSASNAPQPPSRDSIPIVHSTPRVDGLVQRRAVTARRRAMTTSAVSSMSGYQSFSNSKAQPPGAKCGRRTAQSPRWRTSSPSSHRAPRSIAGWSGASPASPRPISASAVSQTGDWHASSRRIPSSTIVNLSRPSRPFWISGCSTG